MRALVFFLIFFPLTVLAQERVEEPSDQRKLGIVAGMAMACNAGEKLDIYESIVSRIFANRSKSPEMEKRMLVEYAKGKTNAYLQQSERKTMSCREILDSFSKMKIFKFELYSDGSLKTPEGRFMYPPSQIQLTIGAQRLYP